jgi:hypothetical protein
MTIEPLLKINSESDIALIAAVTTYEQRETQLFRVPQMKEA